MNKLLNKRTIQMICAVFMGLSLTFAYAQPIFAQDGSQFQTFGNTLADQAQKGVDDAGGSSGSVDLGSIIRNVVNFLLFVIGVLSVIMIIIGGIRYTVSGGDANATKSARDTILYAIIGLVVAFVAFGIVNFVSGIFRAPAPEAASTSIIQTNWS